MNFLKLYQKQLFQIFFDFLIKKHEFLHELNRRSAHTLIIQKTIRHRNQRDRHVLAFSSRDCINEEAVLTRLQNIQEGCLFCHSDDALDVWAQPWGKMMKRLISVAAVSFLMISNVWAADLGGKVLKVGSDTTYPPMETVDPATGQIVGFDVDLVNAICAKINCKAEFVTTAWDGIFGALQQGSFDLVASGVSITDERKQTMDFTEPYLIVSQAVLLRVADEGLTMDDFKKKGLKLAAQTATTNASLAEELLGRDNVALYDTFTGAVVALKNGDVSGVIIDGTSASAYSKEFAGELVVGIEGLKSDPLGLVFQKGDARRDAFNEGLKAIKADGTVDKLVTKYWGSTN